MKKFKFCVFCSLLAVFLLGTADINAKNKPKSKFYDFSEQLIDGVIKRPTTLYTDARTKVKFGRLLSLKKSFIPRLLTSAKEKTFK